MGKINWGKVGLGGLLVGFVGWLLTVVPHIIGMKLWAVGYTNDMLLTILVGGLVQWMATSFVAGWVYTE